METMSLLQEEEPERAGSQRLRDAVERQERGEGSERRPTRKYAEILNLKEKQLKTVAEIYNPERFQQQACKAGLIPGEAFDLVLGDNLLNRKTQQDTEHYFKTVKPGLTLISPPCTMFSQIQNLNRRLYEGAEATREYIKKINQTRILLRFAIRISNLILDYGGKFVFEHPLSCKAWPQKEVQELIKRTDVQLVRSDQCAFGLVSPSGEAMMKPTGWATNSVGIWQALNRRCDQSREHQHTLGSEAGRSRSRHAQEYPTPLVRAIIQGYRKDLQNKEIHINLVDGQIIAEQQKQARSSTRRRCWRARQRSRGR